MSWSAAAIAAYLTGFLVFCFAFWRATRTAPMMIEDDFEDCSSKLEPIDERDQRPTHKADPDEHHDQQSDQSHNHSEAIKKSSQNTGLNP